MQDRPYQNSALSAIINEFQKGTKRQLISMATGTGKTVVFSQLPERAKFILPGQQLVLAHREELIDQAVNKMRLIAPHLRVDKEKAEHRADPSVADVIVASVATLGRKDSKRLEGYNWDRIDKYVTDEAHHSTAQSYVNIYNAAGLLDNPGHRLLLGVTATPQRGDGKALAQIYQKISYVYSMRQAIEDGWLVDVRGFRVSTATSLDAVKMSGGDFAQDMLADAVNNPQRNQLVVKAWLDQAEGRQSIAFTVDIKHAVDLAAMFRKYGVKAEAVWGDDPERASKLQRHQNREITILVNCGVLTEGYDDWRIGCVILARPTKSSVLFTQMVGRGTRLQDGAGNLHEALARNELYYELKRDCIVIDVVDASARHSLITLPTLMGMSARLDLKGGSLVKAIQRLEDAQKECPKLDVSHLADISDLRTQIESVNLFDFKFPQEVEANSEFSWYAAPDGGFIMMLPNKEQVTIRQNILEKWEIAGYIHNRKFKGERDSIEQAFQAADDHVNREAPECLKLIRREEKWHGEPPSMSQMNLLRKFFKGRPLPSDLTKGQASKLIGNFLAGKSK